MFEYPVCFRIVALFTLLLTFVIPIDTEAGIPVEELALHRITYKLLLVGEPPRAISDVVVFITSTYERTCKSWVTNHKSISEVSFTSGSQVRQQVSFSSLESFDGRHYRFTGRIVTEDTQGQKSVKEIRGEATIDSEDGSGHAVRTKPENKEIALPKGSFFPMAYQRFVMKQAQQNVHFITGVVFDGFELDKNGMDFTSTFISTQKPADTKVPTLLNEPFWTVRHNLFAVGVSKSIPHTEIRARLYGNGIALPEVIQFYDPPHRLEVTLKKLELLPSPSC